MPKEWLNWRYNHLLPSASCQRRSKDKRLGTGGHSEARREGRSGSIFLSSTHPPSPGLHFCCGYWTLENCVSLSLWPFHVIPLFCTQDGFPVHYTYTLPMCSIVILLLLCELLDLWVLQLYEDSCAVPVEYVSVFHPIIVYSTCIHPAPHHSRLHQASIATVPRWLLLTLWWILFPQNNKVSSWVWMQRQYMQTRMTGERHQITVRLCFRISNVDFVLCHWITPILFHCTVVCTHTLHYSCVLCPILLFKLPTTVQYLYPTLHLQIVFLSHWCSVVFVFFFGLLTSLLHTLFFCEEMSRYFFPQAGEQGFKHVIESHPSSNSIQHICTVFWLSRIEILRCSETDREGGGFLCNFVHIFLPSWKKQHCRDIFAHKNSQHGKFQTEASEQLGKSLRNCWGRLAQSHSNYCVFWFCCTFHPKNWDGLQLLE